MPSMSTADESPRFEQVDWDAFRGRPRRITAERVTLAVGLLVLLAMYAYDRFIAHVYFIYNWSIDLVHWSVLLGVVILLAYVVVPLLLRRADTKRYLRSLMSRPATLFGTAFLGALLVVGTFGPLLYSLPGTVQFGIALQPPFGFSTPAFASDCIGQITSPDDTITRYCHGTLEYPLGTDHRGFPMGAVLVEGTRIALYVILFTAGLVIPLAVLTGVIAGLRGGWVDTLLMGYVDVQLSIPAIVIYFVGYTYWNPSLWLLLATFGLLSWGGIARLVRSEVLQRREDGHVLVARSQGASWLYVAKRHVIPNITNTIIPAAFHLIALLVLVEAGVAFLGFNDIGLYSWGSLISESINAEVGGQLQPRPEEAANDMWWVAMFPALLLTLTMVSCKLVGDGLRDALDPRGGSP